MTKTHRSKNTAVFINLLSGQHCSEWDFWALSQYPYSATRGHITLTMEVLLLSSDIINMFNIKVLAAAYSDGATLSQWLTLLAGHYQLGKSLNHFMCSNAIIRDLSGHMGNVLEGLEKIEFPLYWTSQVCNNNAFAYNNISLHSVPENPTIKCNSCHF